MGYSRLLNIPFSVAINAMDIFDGKMALRARGKLAIAMASGQFDHEAYRCDVIEKDDDIIATCTVRRLPGGQPITRTFSLKDAQRAGLIGKENWRRYPKHMVENRAIDWAVSRAFADLLLGLAPFFAPTDEELASSSEPVTLESVLGV